jgi:hypothetical protein
MEPGILIITAYKENLDGLKKQHHSHRSFNNTSTDNSNNSTSTNVNNNTITNVFASSTPIAFIMRNSTSTTQHLVVKGRTYILSYCACIYSVHQQHSIPSVTFIYGDDNGVLSSRNIVALEQTCSTDGVTGIAENKLHHIPISTAAGLIQTNDGTPFGIFHRYAHNGTSEPIHCISQLRHFGTIFYDNSCQFGSKQRFVTLDGYNIRLYIHSGLTSMDMASTTPVELETFHH